jgi:hypothetical protein
MANIGFVYKIISDNVNSVYIGSTTKPLKFRLSQHNSALKHYLNTQNRYISSIEVLIFGSCKIELIEEYQYNNINDLRKRERHYIETIPNCINKQIPTLATKTKNYQRVREMHIRPYKCDICNTTIQITEKSRHNKSMKHISNINK